MAITVVIASVLLFILATVGAAAMGGTAAATVVIGGSLLFIVLMMASALMSIVGKIQLLASPVGRELIMTALVFDAFSVLASFSSYKNVSSLTSLVSLCLLMAYLYKLGGYLQSSTIIEAVVGTIKTNLYAIGTIITGVLVALVSPGLMLLFMVIGLVLGLYGFLSYIRCLNCVQLELARYSQGSIERRNPMTGGF